MNMEVTVNTGTLIMAHLYRIHVLIKILQISAKIPRFA